MSLQDKYIKKIKAKPNMSDRVTAAHKILNSKNLIYYVIKEMKYKRIIK